MFVHIKMQCRCAWVCSGGGVSWKAERIGTFELVRLGRPERRTTQAWACSPNKGTKPLHSDWQAVRKASVLTKHVTSRKWSFALFLHWQSHNTDDFASAALQIHVSTLISFYSYLQVEASANDRTRIIHCETQSSCISAVRTFTIKPQSYSNSVLLKMMICLPKADFGLCVLALPGCLLLGPSNGILYETVELKRHSFGPESFCC